MSQTDHNKEIESLRLRAEHAEQDAARLKEEQALAVKELAEVRQTTEIMKSRFLANISHEIRTPMNGILGMTELLLNTDLNESQTRFTRSIAHSTESLLFVVNDLLDFSGLQQGKIELQENLFFFDRVIVDVCKQFEAQANAKNIKLSYKLKNAASTPVVGDEFRVHQVLSNLVDNAIKFTDKGEILLTDRGSQPDGTHTVTVEDSGQGISPQVQTDIFKSFAQGDNSSTRRFGGTGLGLTIANALAMQMNGEISIKSEVNKGSTFTFSCLLKDANDDEINDIGKKNRTHHHG